MCLTIKTNIALIGISALAHTNIYSFKGNTKASINMYRLVTKHILSVNNNVDFTNSNTLYLKKKCT